MTPEKRLERILKDLDVLAREAREAGSHARTLEAKVPIYRMGVVCERVRSELRLLVFDVQDATRFLLLPSPQDKE